MSLNVYSDIGIVILFMRTKFFPDILGNGKVQLEEAGGT